MSTSAPTNGTTADSAPVFWNEDAEQAVLSAMLMDATAIAESRVLLTPASFFLERHGTLFRAMVALVDDGQAVDPLTLSAKLEAMGALESSGGKDYIGYLVDVVPTAANVAHHAQIVSDHVIRRAILDMGGAVGRQLSNGARAEDVRVRLIEQLETIGSPNRVEPVNRFLLRDDEELESLPATEWLIEGILPDDATVAVVGPSGSFKSFLALDWCYHIRTGLDWHGHETRVGEVVYLCGEGVSGITKRSAAWKAQNNFTGRLGVHFITNGLNFNDPVEVSKVIRAIEAKRLGPRLVVIDTLARFLVGDENTSKDMGTFIRSANELRLRFGCTVVIVHHTGKDITKGGRGSNSLNCAIDTEITVDREAGEMAMTLTVSKQKDGKDGAKYTVEAVAIAGSLALKPSKPYGGVLAGKNHSCLLALSEHDEGAGLKYGDWFTAAGVAKGTFDKSRNWLTANSYIRLAKAHYSVSEAGRQALLLGLLMVYREVYSTAGQVCLLGGGI